MTYTAAGPTNLRKARLGAVGVLVIHETAGQLRLGHGQDSNTNAMFESSARTRGPSTAARRLDPARPRRAAVRGFRQQLRALKAAAKRKDFKPVPLKAALDVHGDAKTEVITSTTSSDCCPALRGPMRRSSIPLTGTISASVSPTQRRPHIQWRRSTMAPASHS